MTVPIRLVFSIPSILSILSRKNGGAPYFTKIKMQLIAAMNRELEKIPGVVWGFSQPISDNVEEAVSGVKGELAIKVYGDDLKTLEDQANEIAGVMRQVNGVQDLGVLRVLGQPNLNVTVDRQQAARYQINVADVQDAIQTAVGGNALTQVLQGEARYDLVVRYLPQYRNTQEAIQNIRLLSPSGERVSLAQLCKIKEEDGASEIYREGNQRYIAIKYSVRGRDLGGAVEEAISKVNEKVKMPAGYHIDWQGEYASQKRSSARLMVIVPITVFLIFVIIYGAFGSVKWTLLILINRTGSAVRAVLWRCSSPARISVSRRGWLSGAVRRLRPDRRHHGRIHQPVARQRHAGAGMPPLKATRRLRPIMMTMLVATLGLLPAATSHAIGRIRSVHLRSLLWAGSLPTWC